MRNKKYFIVLFIFIAYAVYDFGGWHLQMDCILRWFCMGAIYF